MSGEKYHISPSTGRPNKCYATKRGCPLGADAEHYPSREEAQTAYEFKMKDQTLTSHKKGPSEVSPSMGGIRRLPKGENRDYTEILRRISARKASERAAEGDLYASEFADIFCSECGRELTGYSDNGTCDTCHSNAEKADYGQNLSLDELDAQPSPRRGGRNDMWDDPDDY